MTHNDYLKQNISRLEKLKANIHIDAIQQYVELLRSKWQPKTETSTAIIPDGSKKGDEVTSTVYYDVYHEQWTTKELAFRGYLFKKITQIINK